MPALDAGHHDRIETLRDMYETISLERWVSFLKLMKQRNYHTHVSTPLSSKFPFFSFSAFCNHLACDFDLF